MNIETARKATYLQDRIKQTTNKLSELDRLKSDSLDHIEISGMNGGFGRARFEVGHGLLSKQIATTVHTLLRTMLAFDLEQAQKDLEAL